MESIFLFSVFSAVKPLGMKVDVKIENERAVKLNKRPINNTEAQMM